MPAPDTIDISDEFIAELLSGIGAEATIACAQSHAPISPFDVPGARGTYVAETR